MSITVMITRVKHIRTDFRYLELGILHHGQACHAHLVQEQICCKCSRNRNQYGYDINQLDQTTYKVSQETSLINEHIPGKE